MFQEVTIVGNIGKDSELRYTPSGTAVTNISVAANRTWKDANGEKVKETVWFKVSLFGKTAENLTQYLTAGKLVLVKGRLVPDKATGGPRLWEKKDGTMGASFDVFATEIRLLGGKRDEAAEAKAESTAVEPEQGVEIPF